MRFKQLLSYVLIIGLAACLAACSDNGSGPDHGEPPSIPDLSKAQPEVSFFQNNTSGKTTMSSVQAYSSAQVIVSAAEAAFISVPVFITYMQQFNQQDAEYSDGMWVWSYQGAQNSSLKLTAKSAGDATEWEMYISGGSVSNFKAVDGTIKNDGQSGVWNLYDLDTGSQVLKSEFEISSDTESDYKVTAYDEGSASVILTFDVDVPVHIFTWDELTNDNDVKIYWNTDTKSGYIIDNSDGKGTQCWDASLDDVSCSDVGF